MLPVFERTTRAWEQPEGTLAFQTMAKGAARQGCSSTTSKIHFSFKKEAGFKEESSSGIQPHQPPSLLLTQQGEGDLPECSEEVLVPLAKKGLRPWLLQSSAVSPTKASPGFLHLLPDGVTWQRRQKNREIVKGTLLSSVRAQQTRIKTPSEP